MHLARALKEVLTSWIYPHWQQLHLQLTHCVRLHCLTCCKFRPHSRLYRFITIISALTSMVQKHYPHTSLGDSLRTPFPGGSTQRGQALYSFGLRSVRSVSPDASVKFTLCFPLGSGRCSSASTISSACPISTKSDIIRKRPRHDARAPHYFLTGPQAPPAP
jgi:hypothetical protein